MKVRNPLIITLVAFAALVAILSLSKCAVDSYRNQAEDRLAPSSPGGLTAVEVSRHGEPVPREMTKEEREHAAWSAKMYAKLNADMESGRRAPNKMGVYEKEEPGGWIVYQGAPPFDPKPATVADTTFAPEEYAPPFDPGVVGQDIVISHNDIGGWFPPGYYGGGGGYVIQTCPECCVDKPSTDLPPSVAVPEPSAIYLLGGGLAALFWSRRKKIS